jgi:hypothetical protein
VVPLIGGNDHFNINFSSNIFPLICKHRYLVRENAFTFPPRVECLGGEGCMLVHKMFVVVLRLRRWVVRSPNVESEKKRMFQ